MNEICFVIIVNNQLKSLECEKSIKELKFPKEVTVKIMTITNSISTTSSYNEIIKRENCRYKIYIREGVKILNENLIFDMLKIFENEDIGMIGVKGAIRLPVSGKYLESKTFINGDNHELIEVQSLSNEIIMTQVDIYWREDLFTDYLYETSQSLEFIKKDYKVVIPPHANSWYECDDIEINQEKENKSAEILLENYNLIDLNYNNLFDFDRESANRVLAYNKAIYTLFLGYTKEFAKNEQYEIATRIAHFLGGLIDSHHGGFFVSPDIEYILNDYGKYTPNVDIDLNTKNKEKRNVLHVLSEGYKVGGHTKLVKYWIKSDPLSVHHLVTTWQKGDTPDWLYEEIVKSGGSIFSLQQCGMNYGLRGATLRQIAYSLADIVVLHTHMMDTIPNIAFGVDGGPPVIFLNHADHRFWYGSSIADIVVDVSESGNNLTKKRRGVEKTFILPIPTNFIEKKLDRNEIRKKYNIDENTKVLLTIASEHKFQSISDIDYCEIAKIIINNTKNTKLIIVGPKKKGKWETLFNITDGRAEAVGIQEDISEFYVMADIYFESFVMGSYTSRLDGILNNLPALKFRNKLYPKITDTFSYLEELSCDTIGEIIDMINKYENKEDNEIVQKGMKMKKLVYEENVLKTKEYIEKIYSLVSTHKVRNIDVNDEIDDYDLFWALYNSNK